MTDYSELDAEIAEEDAKKAAAQTQAKALPHYTKATGLASVSKWVWIGLALVVLVVIVIVVVVILLSPAAVGSGSVASGASASGSGSATSSSSSSSSSSAAPTYPFPADSSSYGILNVSTKSNMQEDAGLIAIMGAYGWKTDPTMQWQFRFIRAGTDPTRQVYAINNLHISESLQVCSSA